MINVEFQFFIFTTFLFFIKKNFCFKKRWIIGILIVSLLINFLFGLNFILLNLFIGRLWQYCFGIFIVLITFEQK